MLQLLLLPARRRSDGAGRARSGSVLRPALPATAAVVFGCLALFVHFRFGVQNLPARDLMPLWFVVARCT